MKSVVFTALTFVVSVLPFSSTARAEEFIQLPEKVFVPAGFDDNDHAEIVLYGHFPDSCYRAGEAAAKFTNGHIVVTNFAYRDEGPNCLKVLVPWTTTVSVGVLRTGTYPIDVQAPNREPIPFGRLGIEPAQNRSIDDYPYAYVNGVLARVGNDRGDVVVTLSGSFGLTCMVLREIKIDREKRDVITILPVVALDRSKACGHPFAPIPFRKTFRVAGPLESRSTLLHVRSMNGQALNQVIEK